MRAAGKSRRLPQGAVTLSLRYARGIRYVEEKETASVNSVFKPKCVISEAMRH